MKTEIQFKHAKNTYLLKSLDTGTVFLWTTKTQHELWMVTNGTAPYTDQIMCVNLQSGKMCDFDCDAVVRVNFDAKVVAEFE